MVVPSPATTRGGPTTADAVFRALATSRRRALLAYLEQTDRTVVRVDDLVDHLAGRADAPSDEDRLEATLGHIDLPKLHDLGLVEYSAARGEIRYVSHPLVTGALELTADWSAE